MGLESIFGKDLDCKARILVALLLAREPDPIEYARDIVVALQEAATRLYPDSIAAGNLRTELAREVVIEPSASIALSSLLHRLGYRIPDSAAQVDEHLCAILLDLERRAVSFSDASHAILCLSRLASLDRGAASRLLTYTTFLANVDEVDIYYPLEEIRSNARAWFRHLTLHYTRYERFPVGFDEEWSHSDDAALYAELKDS
jgi:hypothetical protein